MRNCRNCDSADLQELGFIGEVAPFFLKRVLHLELGFPDTNPQPLKRLVRRWAAPFRGVFAKLYRPSAMIELRLCNSCSFLQTKYPFADDDIMNLYTDYRSDSYNKERTKYEPSYAKLAEQVGIGGQEISVRVKSVTAWVGPKLDARDNFSMLDYGGADGRFLPSLPGARFVFEVSDITPVPGVIRIDSEAALGSYSYIQVAHVLEHVPEPLKFVKKICAFLEPRGYLYVEVPYELDDAKLAELRGRNQSMSSMIHEHINAYTPQAIVALLNSAGLETISVQNEVTDIGWNCSPIIRGLARRI